MDFLKKIRTFYYYTKGKNAIIDDNAGESLTYLQKVNLEIIEKKHYVEYYLFLGWSLLSSKLFVEAEDSLKKVIVYLEDKNNEFNNDEKIYLKCYAYFLLITLYRYKDTYEKVYEIETKMNNLRNKIKMKNVDKKLLRDFPFI